MDIERFRREEELYLDNEVSSFYIIFWLVQGWKLTIFYLCLLYYALFLFIGSKKVMSQLIVVGDLENCYIML